MARGEDAFDVARLGGGWSALRKKAIQSFRLRLHSGLRQSGTRQPRPFLGFYVKVTTLKRI